MLVVGADVTELVGQRQGGVCFVDARGDPHGAAGVVGPAVRRAGVGALQGVAVGGGELREGIPHAGRRGTGEPQFITYALSGAFAFSGLLAYVASSPIVFMEVFHVSAQKFGAIFAGLAVGFGGSRGSPIHAQVGLTFNSLIWLIALELASN